MITKQTNKQTNPTPNMNFPQRTNDNAEGKKKPPIHPVTFPDYLQQQISNLNNEIIQSFNFSEKRLKVHI